MSPAPEGAAGCDGGGQVLMMGMAAEFKKATRTLSSSSVCFFHLASSLLSVSLKMQALSASSPFSAETALIEL